MKLLGKIVAIRGQHYLGGSYFRNSFYSINNLNKYRNFCSNQNDTSDQNENQINKISDKNKQPFLLLPLKFFDTLYKLKIDSKSIIQAAEALQNEAQNNATDIIHLAAVVPVTTLNDNLNLEDHFTGLEEIEKNDEINAYMIKKLNNNENVENNEEKILFELNNDIRQQLEILPISELTLEYSIEVPDLKEAIELFKKNMNNSSLQSENSNDSLVPLQFDAGIKGQIKLKADKLRNILNEMDSEKFNTLISTLTASICGKALEKGFCISAPTTDLVIDKKIDELEDDTVVIENTENNLKPKNRSQYVPICEPPPFTPIPVQINEFERNRFKKNIPKIENKNENKVEENLLDEKTQNEIMFNQFTGLSNTGSTPNIKGKDEENLRGLPKGNSYTERKYSSDANQDKNSSGGKLVKPCGETPSPCGTKKSESKCGKQKDSTNHGKPPGTVCMKEKKEDKPDTSQPSYNCSPKKEESKKTESKCVAPKEEPKKTESKCVAPKDESKCAAKKSSCGSSKPTSNCGAKKASTSAAEQKCGNTPPKPGTCGGLQSPKTFSSCTNNQSGSSDNGKRKSKNSYYKEPRKPGTGPCRKLPPSPELPKQLCHKKTVTSKGCQAPKPPCN